MSKRGARGGKANRHFVRLENQLHYLPAARWHEWIAAGLLILVIGNVADPACPGVVWLENGELHQKQDPIAPWMNLNCRVMERHLGAPRLTPEELQRVIQEQYQGWN